MPEAIDYAESIKENLDVIVHWSFIDEAECRKTLKQVDEALDTLRDYLEGK